MNHGGNAGNGELADLVRSGRGRFCKERAADAERGGGAGCGDVRGVQGHLGHARLIASPPGHRRLSRRSLPVPRELADWADHRHLAGLP